MSEYHDFLARARLSLPTPGGFPPEICRRICSTFRRIWVESVEDVALFEDAP